MISKRIPMNSAKKSSFAGLVKYITGSQGINERVGDIRITNCVSEELDWAVREALATQRLNTRAEGDRTYHLLISFAPGERPSKEVIADVEETICAAMGFGEHQRISALHGDTESLHIHVAINKIHPTRHTMHEPYRDFQSRARACAELELKHGLQRVNHSATKTLSESNAQDMERHAGIESLVSWVRGECLDQLKAASSWRDLHKVFAEHGLELKERGAGFVLLSNDGTAVKASTVSRDLSKSKLEGRLGAFEALPQRHTGARLAPQVKRPGIGRPGSKPPPFRKGRLHSISSVGTLKVGPSRRYTKRPLSMAGGGSTLYARYMDEQAAVRHEKRRSLEQLRASRDRAISLAKNASAMKRNAIKLTRANALAKKALYRSAHSTLAAEMEKAKRDYTRAVEQLHVTHRTRQWKDWLQSKAKAGDEAALDALRKQKWANGIQGDSLRGSGLKAEASVTPVQQHVTKEGTLIYSFGKSSIRDDGSRLQISTGADYAGVEVALRMATARYGQQINVEGTDLFKELVAQTAALRNLPITFEDPALQERREKLQQAIERRRRDERTELRRHSERGLDSDGVERSRGESAGRSGAAAGAAIRGGRDAAGADGIRLGRGAGRDGGAPGAGRSGSSAGRAGSVSVRPNGPRINKPGIGRVGSKPPAFAKNRLRNLSQLGVVQFADRGEVLLPRPLPQQLDQQGAKPDNSLRRTVHHGGVAQERAPIPDATAAKYVAEREAKRAKGFDIPKHRLYNPADEGVATFAGIRRLDGEHMALLQRGEEVLVLPVNEATARRLQRKKLGEPVTANSQGVVKTKGRSR
ncbi:TraI/MobA(P) family conjugative relaxase [Pseudomonas sp. PDM20]|uniref:TraI/MobA(P) family conjugative relaxase n=1 Tax=Pseudomonas sp. PDM20 TaxID=2769254 RepID=UPI00177B0CE0|nr:TraI/MobA(P) family conjugative relaxase [Pseudomonas sp. PDM20]MBD9686829.1 relaxase/mobilization nuclease domain-containing protein [Pseudomonas sp. PDM20]